MEINISHEERLGLALRERSLKYAHSKWSKVYNNCCKNSSVVLENTSGLYEINTTGDYHANTTFLFGVINRTMEILPLNNFVSIQPISTPGALVFYYNPQITTGSSHTDFVNANTSMFENENWDLSRGLATWNTGSTTALTSSQIFSGGTSVLPYSGGHGGLSSLKIIERAAGSSTSGTNLAYSGYGGNMSTLRSPTGVELNPVSLSFDNDIATTGFWFNVTPPFIYVRIIRELTGVTTVNRYRVACGSNTGTAPTAWTLSGITGVSGSWELIDSGTKTDWTSTNYYDKTFPDVSYYAYMLNITGFVATNALSVAEFQLYNETTTPGATGETNFAMSPQNWSQDLFSSNLLSAIVSGSSTANTFYTTWKEYDSLEAEGTVQQVKLNVESSPVSVSTRKIKTNFTEEWEQDIQAYMDAGMGSLKDAYTIIIADEIANEITRQSILDLINIAPFRGEWYYSQSDAAIHSGGSGFFATDQREISGVTTSAVTKEKYAADSLLTKIKWVDGAIRKSCITHGANWILCSSKAWSVIASMDEYSGTKELVDHGTISYHGKLAGTWKVYMDPLMPDHMLLMGYKGKDLEAGYIYAPYTIQFLDDVPRQDDVFQKEDMYMVRSAKKVVNNKNYGFIHCVFPTDGSYSVVNE